MRQAKPDNYFVLENYPQAFEELSLDNKTHDHTDNQGYDGNVIVNHPNNVDLRKPVLWTLTLSN
jgi:hypothetical protein